MYELEEEVIRFVFIAFDGLRRKKEDIAMAYHSIMVGSMLKNVHCGEKTVCIGYLHDIIEDTKYTYDDLLERFGMDIADGVLSLSENENITDYVERKKDFLKKLELMDDDLILVEIADKLHNLVSDYEEYKIKGKDFLITEANNFEELKWYYLELKRIFNMRVKENKLLDRYNKIVYEYFES